VNPGSELIGIGLAVFTAVLNTGLRSRFQTIEGYGTVFNVPESVSGYKALHDLPEGATKTAVLSAFADALGVCHGISTSFALTSLRFVG
jgi:hypothetical protein